MAVMMYDGINSDARAIAGAFPNAPYVAGYLNGTYAWSQADWDLFPKAKHIGITTTASANIGDVLDVETGDATPAQAEAWISGRKMAGYFRPTIYCNLSTVPAVRAGTGKWKLGVDYDLWVAVYDDSQASPYAGSIAKQYASGQNWDLNVVYDVNWPYRVEPKPTPAMPTGFSQTAYPDHTNFGWQASAGAETYDFQLVEGKTQVFRESVTGPNAENVQTKPGVTYAWHVAALNSYGSSGWSPLHTFTTPSPAFPAPSGLRVTPGIVSLAWDAVPDVDGKAPTGYTVNVLDAGKVVKTETTTSTDIVFAGLTRNKIYELEVSADGGQGTPGSAKISVTA